MNITLIGPWLILLVALAGCVLAGIRLFQGKANKGIYVLLVFSCLFVGTNVYGLPFIDHYLNFLNGIAKLQTSPTPETYETFFAKVGEGKITPRYAELGLAYTLDRPLPQMDKLLDKTIAQATDPAGKAALTETLRDFKGRQAVAEVLVQTLPSRPDPGQSIERFDTTTRAMVSREILSLPPAKIASLRVNTNTLRIFAAPLRSRTSRK